MATAADEECKEIASEFLEQQQRIAFISDFDTVFAIRGFRFCISNLRKLLSREVK